MWAETIGLPIVGDYYNNLIGLAEYRSNRDVIRTPQPKSQKPHGIHAEVENPMVYWMKLAVQKPQKSTATPIKDPMKINANVQPRSSWWIVCWVGFWVGCGNDISTQPQSDPPVEPRPAPPTETSAAAPTMAAEEPTPPEAPRKAALLAAKLIAQRTVLQEQQSEIIQSFEAKLAEEVGRIKAHRKLLKAAYDAHESALVFSDGQAMADSANVLLRMIRELPSHGIMSDKYGLDELESLVITAQTAAEPYQKLKGDPPAGKPQTLMNVLEKTDTGAPVETVETALLDVGLTDEDMTDLTAVIDYQKSLYEAKMQLNSALIAADVALLTRFFRYLIDFRYAKIAHPFRAMRKPESAWEAFHKKLLADFKETRFSDLEAAMRSVWPQNPLYEQTRVGLAYYEKLASEVTQTTVASRTFKKGQSGESVKQLQERLAQEGYFSGSLTGHFDEDTEVAVRSYQETHQLNVDGVVAAGTVRSLNVPWSRRAEQVRLSLQRWRESDTRELTGFYIRVNIPQFEAEFWENETLVRKHRVVVGSNAWEKDPDRGIEGYLNRTMLFTDEMELIVLNPLWHVPKRIKETELDKELEKTPDYYEKHNFTVKTLEDGTQQVYQNSGPGNALGQVKFLFPNEYAIYLHDTPKKHLFKKTLRAFSHGCMRVENPLDLAEFLLERDGSLTPSELQKTLKTNRERGIRLNNTIPVVIEYNTVTVSPDGHMMFLFDVYGYDKDFDEGRVPLPKHKVQALDG